MQGAAFLEVARELCTVQRPARQRSAVSRAYYAVLGEMREFYLSNGIKFNNTEVHHSLPASIQYCKETGFVDMAQELRDLCDCRKRADYDLGDKEIENPDVCRNLVKGATDLLSEFGRLQVESLKRVREYVNMRSHGQR